MPELNTCLLACLLACFQLFNGIVREGKTYPQEEQLSLQSFKVLGALDSDHTSLAPQADICILIPSFPLVMLSTFYVCLLTAPL